ncbi:ATP-binding protein [Patescibacteria group bacterium]
MSRKRKRKKSRHAGAKAARPELSPTPQNNGVVSTIKVGVKNFVAFIGYAIHGLIARREGKSIAPILPILKQIVENARDAGATLIEIFIVKIDGEKRIFVRDNGRGFLERDIDRYYRPWERHGGEFTEETLDATCGVNGSGRLYALDACDVLRVQSVTKQGYVEFKLHKSDLEPLLRGEEFTPEIHRDEIPENWHAQTGSIIHLEGNINSRIKIDADHVRQHLAAFLVESNWPMVRVYDSLEGPGKGLEPVEMDGEALVGKVVLPHLGLVSWKIGQCSRRSQPVYFCGIGNKITPMGEAYYRFTPEMKHLIPKEPRGNNWTGEVICQRFNKFRGDDDRFRPEFFGSPEEHELVKFLATTLREQVEEALREIEEVEDNEQIDIFFSHLREKGESLFGRPVVTEAPDPKKPKRAKGIQVNGRKKFLTPDGEHRIQVTNARNSKDLEWTWTNHELGTLTVEDDGRCGAFKAMGTLGKVEITITPKDLPDVKPAKVTIDVGDSKRLWINPPYYELYPSYAKQLALRNYLPDDVPDGGPIEWSIKEEEDPKKEVPEGITIEEEIHGTAYLQLPDSCKAGSITIKAKQGNRTAEARIKVLAPIERHLSVLHIEKCLYRLETVRRKLHFNANITVSQGRSRVGEREKGIIALLINLRTEVAREASRRGNEGLNMFLLNQILSFHLDNLASQGLLMNRVHKFEELLSKFLREEEK